MRLRLPLLWCADCGSQLVNHLFVLVGTPDLVCVFCAGDRAAVGAGAQVAPVHAGSAGFVPEAAEPLPVGEALALLAALGARPVPATAGGAR